MVSGQVRNTSLGRTRESDEYRQPGSSLHALRALKHPRWEDFNYERLDSTKNRLNWLGNGMTLNEQTMTGDREFILYDI